MVHYAAKLDARAIDVAEAQIVYQVIGVTIEMDIQHYEAPDLGVVSTGDAFDLAWITVVFVLSIIAILIAGGLAAYCIYKGMTLQWAFRINPWLLKFACYGWR